MVKNILESIVDKYSSDDSEEENLDFIVFVSTSPECKRGMFPPIMTLIDYDLEAVGSTHLSLSKFNHIAELDLTDNLLSEWSEIFVLLRVFPSLEFLNLSNNLLHTPITQEDLEHHVQQKQQSQRTTLMTKKLVLNGNKINWTSADRLIQIMPQLEELHLSTNNLHNPTGEESIQHENLRLLYLSCNPIDDFQDIAERLTAQCPMLEQLSLSECPVTFNAEPLSPSNPILPNLSALNLSTTKISTWEEVDKLRGLSALTELRIQHVPLLGDCTVHERRSLLIARLPNIQILNGGDIISKTEREDAERAFIRFHLESDPKPQRYHELVAVHGELDPLVNIDLTPDTVVRVKVCHKDLSREEDIHLYQTVQQFKGQLQDWFGVAPQNMKLYYCDKDYVDMAGPEEMKWPQKALYTYNVQNGDKFILDEKMFLSRVRTSSRSSLGSFSPGSKFLENRSITFSISPRNGLMISSPGMKKPTPPVNKNNNINNNNNYQSKRQHGISPKSSVAKNLFGKSQKKN